MISISGSIQKRGGKMVLDVTQVTLAIIIGVLAAIVYSLRILVIMERRVARLEMHIEKLAERIMAEEIKIERKVGARKSSPKKKSRKKRKK
tara:strand:+ start:2975 stop:3247 length:273 start_codon:yes stop_codon:yes gene_type:complete